MTALNVFGLICATVITTLNFRRAIMEDNGFNFLGGMVGFIAIVAFSMEIIK